MNTELSDRASHKSKKCASLSKGTVLLTLAVTALYCSNIRSDSSPARNEQAEIKALSVTWQPYDPDIFQQAKQKGQPVIVYFHADWCGPCIELDRYTFSDIRVIESVKPFLMLKVDWTAYASANDDLSPDALALKEQFTIYGIPTIIFIDMNGKEVKSSRISGFADSEEFLARAGALNSRD